MGDAMNEPEEWMEPSKPLYTVELNAFYMDIKEVTVGQFKQFVNDSGYSYNRWNDVAKYSPGEDSPMIYVNWNDAVAYCEWVGYTKVISRLTQDLPHNTRLSPVVGPVGFSLGESK